MHSEHCLSPWALLCGNPWISQKQSFTAVGSLCDVKALSIPSAFSPTEGLYILSSLALLSNFELEHSGTEGKGSVSAAGAGNLCGCSLSRPCVALMVPSCDVLGCVQERVLVQTAEGAAFWAGGCGEWEGIWWGRMGDEFTVLRNNLGMSVREKV